MWLIVRQLPIKAGWWDTPSHSRLLARAISIREHSVSIPVILRASWQPMLNSQQKFHCLFNSSRGNTTQFTQSVSLRGLLSYIQNEQQKIFLNPLEIPSTQRSTLKCSQDWHSGLFPQSLWIYRKTKKRSCMIRLWKFFYQHIP